MRLAKRKLSPIQKPIWGWLSFFLLNFILFFPLFIAYYDNTSLFPLDEFLAREDFRRKITFIYNRYNPDPFRISLDFVAMSLLFFFIGRVRALKLLWLWFSFFLMLLIYNVYFHFTFSIYSFIPTLASDYAFIMEGVKVFMKETPIRALLAISVIVILCIPIFQLLKFWVLSISDTKKQTPGVGIVFLIACLIGFSRLYIFTDAANKRAQFPPVIFCISCELISNLDRSIDFRQSIEDFDIAKKVAQTNLLKAAVEAAPNINLIMIESYGSIIYSNSEFFEIINYQDSAYQNLANQQLNIVSNLSISPVSGGASWLSYNTLLNGFQINSNELYKKISVNSEYELLNLFKWLNYNSYKTYFLAPSFPIGSVSFGESLKEYYGSENWILHDDFYHYKGPRLGWGSAPTDQYSFSYTYDLAQKQKLTHQPSFTFFLTKDSHNPFITVGHAIDNWKDWNYIESSEKTSSYVEKPEAKNYVKSIRYEFDWISRFLMDQASKNDVTIIIGDHQPPYFNKGADFKTPIHIISSDSLFVNGFKKYGFVDGIIPDTTNAKSINHAGFYSMLVRELVRAYGDTTERYPKYYPEGFELISE